MNGRSLKLIREVIVNSGKLTSIEMSQDSIYLEFKDVELGVPKETEDFSLTVRFALDSFMTVFITISGILNFSQDTVITASC